MRGLFFLLCEDVVFAICSQAKVRETHHTIIIGFKVTASIVLYSVQGLSYIAKMFQL